MKTLHKIIAASLLATAATAGSNVVLAESSSLSANIAMSSNYIWRGKTQSGDLSAVSGGIDYANSGAYAGVWQSNLSAGTFEQDLYAGYSMDVGSVNLDLGYIAYQYPLADSGNFSELYANVGFSNYSAGVAMDSENKTTYISASAEFEVKKNLTVGVTYGSNSIDGSADYSHYQFSLNKGDFTMAYDQTDVTDAKARLSVSWSKGFDL